MNEQSVQSYTASQRAASENRKVRRGDRQTRFLAQSVILEEAGSSSLVRRAILTIALTVVGFLVWSFVTSVDEVAVTSGEVVPSGQVQSVQHLEGGIIKRILIEDGEVVERDQALIELDSTAAKTQLDQTLAREAGLVLQAERMRALGTGTEPNWDRVGPGYDDLVNDQIQIYHGQLQAFENRKETLRNQIEQRRAEVEVLNEQEETLSRTAEILEEELELRQKLYEEGLASKITFLDIKRQVNDVRGQLASLVSDRQKALEALNEARSRLAETDTTLREEALEQLSGAINELIQVRESLAQLRDRVRRIEIRSPVRGIVKGLRVHTVGGVVPPGEVIMEIVPLDKEKIVETRISPRDVGHVKERQPVTVKVTSYDFARFGGITGELKEISASTFLDEDGNPYYKGIVILDRAYVGNNPEQNHVLPGMTVQADIKTGKKTLFEYLMKPVYSSVSTSFRER